MLEDQGGRPPHARCTPAAAMLEEQGAHNLPRTVSPNSPNSISDDLVVLVCRLLPRLEKQADRDNLRKWIEYEADRCSCDSWSCESLPPFAILQLPELLEKLWGWKRLLAYDVYSDDSRYEAYEAYLEKFHANNGQDQIKADNLIREYLQKEKALTSEWWATDINNIPYDFNLSTTIQKYLSGLLNDPEKERHPFLTYAVAYLKTEAELMIEWLRKRYDPIDMQYTMMLDARNVILELAMLKGHFPSAPTAAVLQGIRKEVEDWLKSACNGCSTEATEISTNTFGFALEFLTDKLCEFEPDNEREPELIGDVTSTAEGNQLTGDNTESVSFEKSNQEHCVSPEVEYWNASKRTRKPPEDEDEQRNRRRVLKSDGANERIC